jgi:hypothetical protein
VVGRVDEVVGTFVCQVIDIIGLAYTDSGRVILVRGKDLIICNSSRAVCIDYLFEAILEIVDIGPAFSNRSTCAALTSNLGRL